MKRVVLSIVLALLCIAGHAQKTCGDYVTFPDNRIAGSAYKPRLAIGFIDGKTYLVLRCADPDAYSEFDESSRIVLKLDGKDNVTLPIDLGQEIQKTYDEEFDVLLKKLNKFYDTYSFYPLPDDVVDAIVNQKRLITKVRIVFGNVNVEDYDIQNSYQTKMLGKLRLSYGVAKKTYEEKSANKNSDNDF